MEKNEFCGRDESIVRFSYFLIHIRFFDVFPITTTDLGIYRLKVDNENTRTRCEIHKDED